MLRTSISIHASISVHAKLYPNLYANPYATLLKQRKDDKTVCFMCDIYATAIGSSYCTISCY